MTLAAGAAAGKFLKYERDAPTVAAQTAYGIEVEVEGYEAAYDPATMLFMDFRRHHTGVWQSAASRCACAEMNPRFRCIAFVQTLGFVMQVKDGEQRSKWQSATSKEYVQIRERSSTKASKSVFHNMGHP